MNTAKARPFTGLWPIGMAAVAAFATACATSDFDPARIMRPGQDLPARFEPGPGTGGALSGASCRSPLVDPRDGSQIRMVRSGSVQADYAVAGERYGVGAGELLRVDCATGEPAGVVRR